MHRFACNSNPGRRKAALFFVLLLGALLLEGCEQQPDYPKRSPSIDLRDEGHREAGKELFLQKCAGCHGHADEGQNPRARSYTPTPPTFTETAYRRKEPAYLYWRIARGKTVEPYRSRGSVMPAWGPHLSESQIWQLVAYLQSRSQSSP